MKLNKMTAAACAALMTLVPLSAMAESSFTLLGTQAGPIPIPGRSQPANLFRAGGTENLIDVGDNTAHQLFKAGVMTRQLDRVFISHLHGDHFGGLFAILALRVQTNPENLLEVYGPPGTERMVAGLLDALAPAMEAGYGTPGAPALKPEDLAFARDIRGGETLEFPGFTLTTVNNTHYSFAPGTPQHDKFQSLSFRFQFDDRSLVYTGDTGPSGAVIELAKDADVLVGEVFEVEPTLGLIRAQSPNLTDQQLHFLEMHLRQHHLTATQLGEMAAAAGVGKLVVTHIGTDHRKFDPAAMQAEIGAAFGGEITIGKDRDSF